MRKSRREPPPGTRSFPYPPDARHGGTTSLAPRIYEGGGPRSGRGSPPAAAAGTALSVTALPCQLPQRGSRGRYAPFLPPAFMRGRATQWQGEPPAAAAGKASSVTALPCQLPQRGSQGRFAPFLPPAFMRGEGHAVAGGVPRRSGKALSVALRVPALPEGEPRELRTVLAPRIYEGGGPRSGGGSPPRRGRPSQSRFARQLSQRESQGGFAAPALPEGEPGGAALRSPVVGRDPLGWQKMWKSSGFFLKKGLQNRGDSGIIPT